MKKLLTVAAASLLLLAGCSSAGPAPTEPAPRDDSQEAPAAPLDLTGEWKQTNSNAEDAYQTATITTDTISIDWVNEADSSTSIYWAGTYAAPTGSADSYTWDSTNDKSVTDTALLASGDDTKTFTYEGGVLSYDVTAMGTTQTVELERQ